MKKNKTLIPETAEQSWLTPLEPLKLYPFVNGKTACAGEEENPRIPDKPKDPLNVMEKTVPDLDHRCAFENGSHCRALVQKRCVFCRFFQTPAQLQRGREQAKNRLKVKGLREKYLEKYGEHMF